MDRWEACIWGRQIYNIKCGFAGPSEPYGSMGGMHLGSADIQYKCFDLASVSSAVSAIPTRLSRCRVGISVSKDRVYLCAYSRSAAQPPSR